ncbi:4529_t:CDS:2 [Cetraspora pellucida]|uniref:4529_t:CDS:1 n=1 Tax=Cetraspora pellucida TaxID=1433469 RepID=A0ACA9KTB8_9GLOM|nr:4529_t:CDS:2 [Cetraspora pellucida]
MNHHPVLHDYHHKDEIKESLVDELKNDSIIYDSVDVAIEEHQKSDGNKLKAWNTTLSLHKYNSEENLQRAVKLFKEATNYDEVIKYLTLAANNGNLTAMYNVGSAYWIGKEVTRD